MGKVFGTVFGKGGIGKTTSTHNIMAMYNILERDPHWIPGKPLPEIAPEEEVSTDCGIDLDPQANLTRGSGVWLEEDENGNITDDSVHEVLLNADYGIEYAVKRSSLGYDILPATPSMDNLEQEIKSDEYVARDFLLSTALRNAEGSKDYPIDIQAIDRRKRYFADTPRNLGPLTINVMIAADYILVPFKPEFYSDDSMEQLQKRIKQVRKIKPGIKIDGIILTMIDRSALLHKTIEAKLREEFGNLVFQTVIPRNIRLAEAPGAGMSIFQYDSTCTGAVAYYNLVQEMKERFPDAN